MQIVLSFPFSSPPPTININIRIFSITWGGDFYWGICLTLRGNRKLRRSCDLILCSFSEDSRFGLQKKSFVDWNLLHYISPKGGKKGLLKYILLSTHFLKSEFCFWTSLAVKTIHKAFILKLLALPNSVPKDNLSAARLNKDTLSPEEAWYIYCSDSVTNGDLKNVHLKWVWSARAECMCMCIHNSRKLHS